MSDVKPPLLYLGTCQRISPEVHLAEVSDGLARFLWAPLGLPTMAAEDWRQWEITPENAQKMVDQGNADIAAGEDIWVDYGHDDRGRRAADVVRFELGPEGVFAVVHWNEAARASLNMTPPEWKFFSPEWYVTPVLDEGGKPLLSGGRELFRPFRFAGGALTNTPSMERLAAKAASLSRARPGPPINDPSPLEASRGKEKGMKKVLAVLGLAEDASEDDAATAAEALKVRAEAAPPPPKPRTVDEEVAFQLAAVQRKSAAKASVEDAARVGKISAKQVAAAHKIAAANLEAWTEFLAEANATIPTARPLDASADAPLEANDHAAIAQRAKAHQEKNGGTFQDAVLAVTRKAA